MKKRIILLILLTIFLPKVAYGANGTISITGPNTAVLNNQVTVKVTLSSTSAVIGAWEMRLNYDRNFLELTSTNSEGKGIAMVNSVTNPIRSKTYSYTFRAKKTGTTNISIGSFNVIAWDETDMKITRSSKNINIITQQQLVDSYSKNNYLKSLQIEGFEMDKGFDKNILEYSVDVSEDTKIIKISATPEDNRSTISGIGDVEVSLGINTIPIIVRAQNGSEKEYKLVVNVVDKDPINVKVNKLEYSVVKMEEQLPEKNFYEPTEVIINSIKIPALYNSQLNITLVGLKDEEGNVELFKYENDLYEEYIELNFNGIYIIPYKKQVDIKGYKTYNTEINSFNIDLFKYNKKSNYGLLYGTSVIDGKTNLYEFDLKNKTLSIYNDELYKDLISVNNKYIYLIAGFSVILILQFILLLKKRK